jgi:hypothetical protein
MLEYWMFAVSYILSGWKTELTVYLTMQFILINHLLIYA